MEKITTFLHVDDDTNDIFMVEEVFKKSLSSLQLKSVHDGIEAKRYLEGKNEYADRKKYPMPNVVLLDLKMPRFSGFDFLEWMHAKSSGQLHLIPIVVMTSSVLPADVTRAYALGANSYVVKPGNWEQFSECIKALGMYWSGYVVPPVLSPISPEPTTPPKPNWLREL